MPDDWDPLLLEFADFELDPRRHELRRQGRRVPLQEQPSRILACLLERPGEIVTREALRVYATYLTSVRGRNGHKLDDGFGVGVSVRSDRAFAQVPKDGARLRDEADPGI